MTGRLWTTTRPRCPRPRPHLHLHLRPQPHLRLQRHLRLNEADTDLQRLALSICGLGVHLHVGHDMAQQLAPAVNAGPDALDVWADRLVMYALAMVQAEARRRGLPSLGDEPT